MRDDGYTAGESLAALAIISLAMGGLTSSIYVIARDQGRAQANLSDTVLQRAATDRLEQLLAPEAPFRSDQPARFSGDARQFDTACGAERCWVRLDDGALLIKGPGGAQRRLSLPAGESGASLSYVGSNGVSDRWPPLPLPPPALPLEILNAVVVNGAGGSVRPLVIAKLWAEQRYDCEYDIVVQDCRGAGS